MKCVLPGVNIKVFGRAIHSLAKIGEELYIEPQPAGVSFRTVNSARSAFAAFHFGRGFFSHYDEGSVQEEPEAEDDAVKCKVAMKGFLSVFKSLASLERTVERCKLMMDWEEAKLVIQLTCRHGIVKTFNIAFIECETLQAVYNKGACSNHVSSVSRVLFEAVGNFQQSQDEVTFSFTPNKAVFRTYVDEPDPSKVVHTVVTLQPGEFESYDISSDCEITFCLKELKAVLAFTEPVNLSIKADFSDPGCPVILSVDNKPMFEGTFVLATLSQKSDTQTTGRGETSKAKTRAHHDPSQMFRGKHSRAQDTSSKQDTSSDDQLRNDDSDKRRTSEEISNASIRLNEKRVCTSSDYSNINLEEDNPKTNHPLSKTSASTTPIARAATFTPVSRPTNLTPVSRAASLTTPVSKPTILTPASRAATLTTPLRPSDRNNQNGNVSQMDASLPSLGVNNKSPMEVQESEDGEDDYFPATPPAKKAKYIFRRCFESTFDPHSIPGHDIILAEDSDE